MSIRQLPILCMLIVAMLSAIPCSADYWYQHYAKAERALDREEWSEAIQELNNALERRGESGARTRSYGMKVVDYFPYLKLGIAYYHLGHNDAALKAFETERHFLAIETSAEAFERLVEFESLAKQVLIDQIETEHLKINDITERGVNAAASLQAAGNYDEAVKELGRVLSVNPDHAVANALLEEIRLLMAEEEKNRAAISQARQMMVQARSLLDDNRVYEAKTIIDSALGIDPSLEVADLLVEIETAIALSSAPAATPKPQSVADFEADLQREMQASLERWLKEAGRAFDDGRFEASVVAANRALALDNMNERAAKRIAAAYREINRELLSVDAPVAPGIRFTDLRQSIGNNERAQLIDQPVFQLHGVVIDDTEVDIKWLEPEGVLATLSRQELAGVIIIEFNLEAEVTAGTTDFVLQARDHDGLVTLSKYRVIYRRPWHKSPWLWVAVAGCVITLIMIVNARREQRRRSLLSRRFNPYIAGSPIHDEAMFFGRQALIDRILQTIHNNSVLVFGERRIGKTSLQHQLKRRLETIVDPDFEFFPIFIDLQGTAEQKFFGTIATEVRQELAEVLGFENVDEKVDEAESFTYRELVSDLRSIISTLEKTTDKRVRLVLLIDEVDELNAYDQRVSQRLRSLFMKSFAESLVAVVSGVEIKREWDREGSPWYNFFEEIEIHAIDRAAAEQLITLPVNGLFTVKSGVVDRIIDLTGCRPYQIQRLCVALVNHMHETGNRRMDISDVEKVVGQANYEF